MLIAFAGVFLFIIVKGLKPVNSQFTKIVFLIIALSVIGDNLIIRGWREIKQKRLF